VDIYAIPSELLPTLPEISVDGVEAPVSIINTTQGNIYVSDHQLSGSGDYTITVSGRDLAGNDTLQTSTFVALRVNASQGGRLLSATGPLQAEFPPYSFKDDEYVIAYQTVEGSAHGSTVLYGVELLSGQMRLDRRASLKLGFRPYQLSGADPSRLGIYRLKGTDWVRLDSYLNTRERTVEVSIEELGSFQLRIDEYSDADRNPGSGLLPNYPNPFNGSTSIRYSVSRSAHVGLYIVNVRGQRVRTLIDGTIPGGSHVVNWDGRSDSGVRVATGVYLIVLNIDGKIHTRKALLLR
jgi:hypothetical protein